MDQWVSRSLNDEIETFEVDMERVLKETQEKWDTCVAWDNERV